MHHVVDARVVACVGYCTVHVKTGGVHDTSGIDIFETIGAYYCGCALEGSTVLPPLRVRGSENMVS